MTTRKLTDAESRCLRKMHEAGGSGVIGKYGRVIAGGDKLSFDPVTYLRLVGLGMLHFTEPTRLALTEAGRDAADGVGGNHVKS